MWAYTSGLLSEPFTRIVMRGEMSGTEVGYTWGDTSPILRTMSERTILRTMNERKSEIKTVGHNKTTQQ